jgi:hypothetical protein
MTARRLPAAAPIEGRVSSGRCGCVAWVGARRSLAICRIGAKARLRMV